jgi:hypothetical protein
MAGDRETMGDETTDRGIPITPLFTRQQVRDTVLLGKFFKKAVRKRVRKRQGSRQGRLLDRNFTNWDESTEGFFSKSGWVRPLGR